MKDKEGQLYFDARIATENLAKDVEKVKGQLREVSDNAKKEGEEMATYLRKVGTAIGGIFTVGQAVRFVEALRDVRGEFQELEIAFSTMLGSEERAEALMSQLMETARKTPFEMKDVANGAKQLLAYGTASEEVNETLIKLGDIASGLSIPLGDLVYLYGTTMTQGRLFTQDLRQFMGRGIPLAEELANQFGVAKEKVGELVTAGKVGAEEVKKALFSLADGKFKDLMAKKSESLKGQWSNLQDSIEQMMNEIGESSEGLMSGAIEGATALVENYKSVGREIGGLVVAFGAYKTAVITLSVAQKVATGTAKGLTVAQSLLNKTVLANPYVLAGVAVAGLVYSFYRLITAEGEAEKATKKVRGEVEALGEKVDEQRAKAGELLGVIQNETETQGAKAKAYEELQKIYPGLLKNYSLETLATIEQTKAERELNEERDRARLREASELASRTYKAWEAVKDQGAVVTGNSITDNIAFEELRKRKERAKAEAEEARKVFLELQKESIKTLAPKDNNGATENGATENGATDNAPETKEVKKSWQEYARETEKAIREAHYQIREAQIKEGAGTLQGEIDRIHLEADRRREEVEDMVVGWVASYKEATGKNTATIDDLTEKQKEAYQKLLGVVDAEERAEIKKTQDEALKDFLTFTQKREKLVREWAGRIENAQKAGATAEQIAEARRKEEEALNELDATFAQKQDTFQGWVEELTGKGLKELQSMLAKARLMLKGAELDGNAEEIATAKALIKETEKALKGLSVPTPSGEDLSKWTELHETLSEIGREFEKLGGHFGGVLGELLGGVGKAVTQAGQLANAIGAVGKATTSVAKLTAGAGVAGAAIGILSTTHSVAVGVRDELDKQREEARQFQLQTEALNDTIEQTKRVAREAGEALQIFNGDAYSDARRGVEGLFGAQGRLNALMKETIREVEAQQKTPTLSLDTYLQKTGDDLRDFSQILGNIQVKVGEKGWWLWKHDVKDALANLVPELFGEDGTLIFDALDPFLQSDVFERLPEEYQALFEKLKDEHEAYTESLEGVQEYLGAVFGGLGDELMQGLIGAFEAGEDATQSFARSVEGTLEKLVSDMIFSQVFSSILKPAEEELQKILEKGGGEASYFDYFAGLLTKLEDGEEQATKMLEEAQKAGAGRGLNLFRGDDDNTAGDTRKAQTRGLAQASQDSVDELSGRATAIQEHTYVISENTKLLLQNSSSILNHVAGIHTDTARLKAIEDSTRATQRTLTEIHDKGIRIK